MSQYILLNRLQVQGANAVAGFTWGFPAVTHFLGYTHNLSRKLSNHADFAGIVLKGCAVIAHQHRVHTYGFNQFVQSKNPAYQPNEQAKNKVGSPPVIEEGKMDLTVSLLIEYEGEIATRKEALTQWLTKTCQRQRLAGGTILNIADIDVFTFDDEEDKTRLRRLIRKLLPGFVLLDRAHYLQQHFHALQQQNENTELFDAWLDFIALKQKARPVYHLIDRYLTKQAEAEPENYQPLLEQWQTHLEIPYSPDTIPDVLKTHFAQMPEHKANKKLLIQWQEYCNPTDKTDAIWQYVDKPESGFLVPLMVGYKAISRVYKNQEVANTRDDETDVCFVEAVHSIGQWQGIHRIKTPQDLAQAIWRYHYEENWYLCRQDHESPENAVQEIQIQASDDDWS